MMTTFKLLGQLSLQCLRAGSRHIGLHIPQIQCESLLHFRSPSSGVIMEPRCFLLNTMFQP